MRRYLRNKEVLKNCHIYQMLRKAAFRPHLSFHTPGHKIGRWDITELSFSDNLSCPRGAIARAEEDITKILGAEKSFIFTDGSTSGVLSMLHAARAMGVKELAIAFRHVLPNIVSVVLVSMTLDFAGCLLTESSLSYLGFGVQQPQPTWGNMLSGSNNSIVIQNYWWQWLFPALFLSLATVCINVVGDALRDALDPKSNAKR